MVTPGPNTDSRRLAVELSFGAGAGFGAETVAAGIAVEVTVGAGATGFSEPLSGVA